MWWLIYSLFLTQPSWAKPENAKPEIKKKAVSKPVTPPTAVAQYPVLNNGGLDENTSLIRVSLASKKKQEELESFTIGKLRRNKAKVLAGGDIVYCKNNQKDSMSRLKRRIEQAQNSIYFGEMEAALAELTSIADNLNCLEDEVSPESIANLFYLQGVVLYELGRKDETKPAYTLAVQFHPTKRWNEEFPQDSKPLFDAARKETRQAKKAKLEILPFTGGKTVLIDGIDVRTGDPLSAGKHLLQIQGEGSAWITVRPNATAVKIVIPKHLPEDVLSWSEDPAKQKILGDVLQGVLPKQQLAFLEQDRKVWQFTVGQQDWKSLEIPRTFIEPGTAPGALAARVMTWTGAATAVIGGGIATYSALQTMDAARQGDDAVSYETYSTAKKSYNTARDRYRLSLGITLGGVAMSGGGFAWSLKY